MSAEKNRALITRFYEAFARRDGAATAACCWEAKYQFSKTGRHMRNIIDAEFGFKDGLIVEHDDRFDFWRWNRQAPGAPGVPLGWSGCMHGKLQAEAAKGLSAFQRKH